MTTFTQAEREKMVKLFESSTQCRLSPKALLRDEWFHSSHLIYDGAYAKLIAMIRGEKAEPSDEWCNAFLKGRGEWIEPYDPPTECGVQVECEITQEWADELNAEARAYIRKGFAAALSAAQCEGK